LFFSGFIGLFFALALVGVNPREAIQASFVITTQICTGAALWRIIKVPSKESIHELFGVGLAVGSSVAVLSHLVLFRTFIGGFSWIVPSIVLLIAFRVHVNFSCKLGTN
jgi:undecaprenyl pyrophosphate phosphatase UppP